MIQFELSFYTLNNEVTAEFLKIYFFSLIYTCLNKLCVLFNYEGICFCLDLGVSEFVLGKLIFDLKKFFGFHFK